MTQPPDERAVRQVMGMGRLAAWQAVQVRKALREAAAPPDATPTAPLDDAARPDERRPLPSLLGVFGIGLALWCAWLLAAQVGRSPQQMAQAWGGVVGGLVLVAAAFRLQRRAR